MVGYSDPRCVLWLLPQVEAGTLCCLGLASAELHKVHGARPSWLKMVF